MKKVGYFLSSALVAFVLTSCGGKSAEKSGLSPQEFYTSVSSSVDVARNSYFDFSLFADELEYGATKQEETKAMFASMEKLLAEEKKKVEETQAPEDADAKKLKDAAVKFIDVLIDGSKKELLDIKNLVVNNPSVDVDHMNEISDKSMAFDERSTVVFDAYLDQVDAYTKKNNLKQ